MDQLLTIDEVSKLLKISKLTLKRWEAKGKISCLRVGPSRMRRYRKEDLEKMLVTSI